MKNNIKLLLIIIMMILIGLSVNHYLSDSTHLEEKDNVYEIKSLIDENLGELATLTSQKEKHSLYHLYSVQQPLYKQRILQDRLYPGPFETLVSKLINNKLESYTKKYLFIEESLVDKLGYDPYHNYEIKTLRKLKDHISTDDYNQIIELYSATRIHSQTAREKIFNILSTYEHLNPTAVLNYLIDYKAHNHNAEFVINSDLSLTQTSSVVPKFSKLSEEVTHQYEIMWQEIIDVIPANYLTKFKKVEFLVDREDSKVIEMNYESPTLVIDPLDFEMVNHYRPFYESILHQLFHLILVNDNQVVFSSDYDLDLFCQKGFIAKPTSILNEFYQKFWYSIYNDRQINELTVQFYARHQEEFITPYAATSPIEDASEVFSYFILDDLPEGKTATEQKILFLYQYPELMELRRLIRSNIYR